MLIVIVQLPAFGYDFQIDTYLYNIKRDAVGVYAEFAGCSERWMGHGNESATTDIVIPSEVTYADRTYPVRGIGPAALVIKRLYLTSLYIPKSIEYIDRKAYYDGDVKISMECVTSIRVDADNPYWDSREDCNCLIETATNTIILAGQDAFIPSSVTDIDAEAFKGTKITTAFTIPSTVKTIGQGAFRACSMSSVSIEAPLELLPDDIFYRCSNLSDVKLPTSLKELGRNVFLECVSLSAISLPPTLTAIGYSAFAGCSNITSIELPSDVEIIGKYAFNHCKKLSTIQWSSALQVIDSGAFQDCDALTQVTLPTSVIEVHGGVFSKCDNLVSLDMPSVELVGQMAFYSCPKLEKVSLPAIKGFKDFKDYYGNGCFEDCTSLRKVTLSDELATLPFQCFQNCTALKDINLPSALTRIEHRAFYGCKMETIVLPERLKEINQYAFWDCTDLRRIILLAQTPPYLYENAFTTDTKHFLSTLYVPEGTKPAYVASKRWNDFYFIEEFDATGINAPQAPQTTNSKSVNRKCFDLSGRHLAAPPARGLYIEDGTLKAK